jgi:hypothetical protein
MAFFPVLSKDQFLNQFGVKTFEKSTFKINSLGKSKGNKAVSKFGSYLTPSMKIRPQFGRGFVRPITFFTRPLLSFAAEHSATWQLCPLPGRSHPRHSIITWLQMETRIM